MGMVQVGAVLPPAGSRTPSASSASTPSDDRPRLRRMDAARLCDLWPRLAATYPLTWAKAMGDAPVDADGRLTTAGHQWACALAGLTDAQLTRGVIGAALRRSPYLPAPGEFRALCLDIPPLERVRAELHARDLPASKRTAFARLVWSRLDPYRWRQADADRAERMLAAAYESAIDHVMRGGELPAPVSAELGHAPAVQLDPAVQAEADAVRAAASASGQSVAAAAMERVRRALGGGR